MKKRIVNLTQHAPTPPQIEAGVFDLSPDDRERLIKALTFTSLPSAEEVQRRAEEIADLAQGGETMPTAAMIGGAPYLMGPLERALIRRGITPLYAFSKRESTETVLDDGTIRKTAVFRHIGFVPGAMTDNK